MRPEGPGDLFFPNRLRAARSSLGVTDPWSDGGQGLLLAPLYS